MILQYKSEIGINIKKQTSLRLILSKVNKETGISASVSCKENIKQNFKGKTVNTDL
jgi:hypothetical protein